MQLRQTAKRLIPPDTLHALRDLRSAWGVKLQSAVADPRQFDRSGIKRYCPICEFHGRFWSFGSPPRSEAMCPNCLSLERHRLVHMLFETHLHELAEDIRILHFAPEPFLRRRLQQFAGYIAVDFVPQDVDLGCAMDRIPFSDGAFDLVIANHVLEHVGDEATSLREVHRVMARDGRWIVSVPQVHAWDHTYEDDSSTDPEQRRLHFGQSDHLRIYGRDIEDKLTETGFSVARFQMDQHSEIQFRLSRGETVYVATRH